jgi:hypothetical protein
MRRIASKVHAGLAFLTLAAVVVQFFLAGLGVFGAEPYDAHKINGYLILLAALILLVLALIGRLDRERIGTSAGLVVLMIVQIALIESGRPWIEAIHPLLALAILGASFRLALRGRDAFGATHAGDAVKDVAEPHASPTP